jgi:hypothetical protein
MSLPKAGYNRNFPRKALHGPPSFVGGGVHHLYATVVAKHVQDMMTEAPQDSPTGQLICTSIEQAKLELGLEGRLSTITSKWWDTYSLNAGSKRCGTKKPLNKVSAL